MQNIDRPILADDHTAWPRLTAPTLQDRTIEHQPTAVPGAKPVTIGHGLSTLAWVQGSWRMVLAVVARKDPRPFGRRMPAADFPHCMDESYP